jgi:hypothetical protein
MSTRVAGWASQGCFYHLSIIPDNEICTAYNFSQASVKIPSRKDEKLTRLFLVPIYDEDNIETFQQFAGFDHHMKCPAFHWHSGLDQILRHRCPVTTTYLCRSHISSLQTVSASDICSSQQIFVAPTAASPNTNSNTARPRRPTSLDHNRSLSLL